MLRLLVIHFVVVSRHQQTLRLTSDECYKHTMVRTSTYHLHSMSPLGGPPGNTAMPFGMEKQEWWVYPMVKKH